MMELPDDALHLIFANLPVSDLIQVSEVGKAWNRAVSARWLHNRSTLTFNDDAEFTRGFRACAEAQWTNYHRLSVSGVTIGVKSDGFGSLLPRLSFLEPVFGEGSLCLCGLRALRRAFFDKRVIASSLHNTFRYEDTIIRLSSVFAKPLHVSRFKEFLVCFLPLE